MLTILAEPQWTGGKTSHSVKKFEVPDYLVTLLRNLLRGLGSVGTSS